MKNQLLRTFGILAAVLLFGAGIAAAESHLNGDDDVPVEVDCDDEANADDEACQEESGDESTDESTDEVDCDDEANADDEACQEESGVQSTEEGNGEGDGPPEGTHGAIVSEAAKNHEHDEECGNHGAYVSSVARGLEECAVPPGLENRPEWAGSDDDGDDEVQSSSNRGGGRPAHAGPPAGQD
jgi:hypothetical protein